jgi:hypothetical protein
LVEIAFGGVTSVAVVPDVPAPVDVAVVVGVAVVVVFAAVVVDRAGGAAPLPPDFPGPEAAEADADGPDCADGPLGVGAFAPPLAPDTVCPPGLPPGAAALLPCVTVPLWALGLFVEGPFGPDPRPWAAAGTAIATSAAAVTAS